MTSVAAANAEEVEAWGGVLFDRWVAFRDVVAREIAPFSERAFALYPPPQGGRALDIGCGLGETTLRLAQLMGEEAEVVGIDAGERFIETARDEAEAAEAHNVSYVVGDVQAAELGSGFDYAFSRFGTMFFASPVAALRNVRSSMRPGGQLCMIVWRSKVANEWLHRGELVADRFLERPEETDEPTCGPGPFSMANADTVTDILVHSGFEDIALHRCDIDYRLGDDLDQALALVMALGPAGELIRLAKDQVDEVRPKLEAALRDAYADLEGPAGVFARASAWIVAARAPVGSAGPN